jgi:hypothetical protein
LVLSIGLRLREGEREKGYEDVLVAAAAAAETETTGEEEGEAFGE